MFEIRQTSSNAVAESRHAYTQALSAPLDGMWEAFIGLATAWEIRDGDEQIGHFAVNEEGRLLQFHLVAEREHQARDAFAQAIEASGASGAMVSTFEPWLPFCLDVQRESRVHSNLYHDHLRPEIPLDGFEDVTFGVVPEEERTEVEAFIRGCFDEDPGEWLAGYLENLVRRGEQLALRSGGALLGTGELRVSDSRPPYVDLGVIVGKEYRRRGLATHILWQLKERAYAAGQIPICLTTVENKGSQKAIARAGFVARYRLLEILF